MDTKKPKVGKYLIISKIAEGGMGAVYKAKHPTLNRDVILKKLTLKRSASITERFKREARLMIDFRNDHIVQVYDHFKEGNSYYIAMEYINGISLGELIKRKRYLSNEMAMLIFSEICKALKYAHEKNVIHRDIKPDNILISNQGEVKLTDFGIATSTDDDEDGLTTDGMTLGTPAYMSPEQITDTKNVDKRADIYSMGVLFYEMVTGKCPFPKSFTPDAISLIQKGDYQLPRKINPRVAPVIQKIIKKAMHHKINKRYKNLEYIIALLSRHIKKFKYQGIKNNAIKNYVYNTEESEIDKTKSEIKFDIKKLLHDIALMVASNSVRIILAIIIVLGILSGTSFYLYTEGFHYEYIKSEEYGALKLCVRIKKKYKNTQNIYINASLFKKLRKGHRKLRDINLNFELDREKKSKNYSYFITKKIYLKASNYRTRIEVESQLYQEDFYLNPRIIQREEKDSLEAKIIQVNNKIILRLPIMLYYSVNDRESSINITNETNLFIKYRKKWYKWEKYIELTNFKTLFTTGKSYRFKFSKEGYHSKLYRIYVEPYQTSLNLQVNLIPIPGILLIKSKYKGLDILLNNSNYYSSGAINRKYREIYPSQLKYQKLYLSPGDYFITVKKSNSISKTERISIEPNKSKKILITYNEKKELININIQ